MAWTVLAVKVPTIYESMDLVFACYFRVAIAEWRNFSNKQSYVGNVCITQKEDLDVSLKRAVG